jgi:beta-phosphoglucomutase-like phosphatase (HAD superfamily)
VCAYEDERRVKLAPDLYLAAARCLGQQAGECVAVEGSPVGLEAAMAAGIHALAVPNERLMDRNFPRAEACFASLGELTATLDIVLAF